MVFQSLTYLVFLTLVVCGCLAVHFGAGRRDQERAQSMRNLWLLVAGYTFYGWVTHWWIILIGLHTVVDYTCVRLIAATDDAARRRQLLIVSLLFSFLILATFKYFGFFVGNVTAALEACGVPAAWLADNPAARFLLNAGLPAGISFFTFQSAGYVIDVFRRKVAPPRSWLDYAVFVSFFPQLVSGVFSRR
jgi:alginate O-acetyltransferase complex protein AlgI